jgi:hypothetical protein
MRLVEDSFDITQLQRWEKGEQRIRVRNSSASASPRSPRVMADDRSHLC